MKSVDDPINMHKVLRTPRKILILGNCTELEVGIFNGCADIDYSIQISVLLDSIFVFLRFFNFLSENPRVFSSLVIDIFTRRAPNMIIFQGTSRKIMFLTRACNVFTRRYSTRGCASKYSEEYIFHLFQKVVDVLRYCYNFVYHSIFKNLCARAGHGFH